MLGCNEWFLKRAPPPGSWANIITAIGWSSQSTHEVILSRLLQLHFGSMYTRLFIGSLIILLSTCLSLSTNVLEKWLILRVMQVLRTRTKHQKSSRVSLKSNPTWLAWAPKSWNSYQHFLRDGSRGKYVSLHAYFHPFRSILPVTPYS